MTTGQIGLCLLGIFVVLLLIRVPIFMSLCLSSIVTLYFAGLAPEMFADIMSSAVSSSSLMAIPFFIIAGNIMDVSGISDRIVRLIELLIGPIPGGLGIVSVVVCMFWGAISGSGPATVVALGPVLIPLMVNAGYSAAFAGTVLASAAGIAIIIPPSITFIVYGTIVEGLSIGRLFAAGAIPGIAVGLAYCVYVFIVSVKRGYKGRQRGSLKEIWAAFKSAFWGILSPVVILGGIYGGIFTPTEAACIAAVYSLIIGMFVYRKISLKQMVDIFVKSATGTTMILLITAGAGVMAWVINTMGVADAVTKAILSISSNPYVIVTLVYFILIAAGFFLEGISICYLLVPLLLPVVQALGYDPTWFGVILVQAISVGMITPPVAGNLYPAALQANVPLHAISKEVWGFTLTGIVIGLVLIYFPAISLWLPNLMGL